MRAKRICLYAWVLTLLGAAGTQAQPPAEPGHGPARSAPVELPAGGVPAAAPGLPCWSSCGSTTCCGPLDNYVPMRIEVQVQAGASIPFGSGIFGDTLDTGWMIRGNSRALFFNQPQTAAWAFDLGLSNIYNDGRNPQIQVPVAGVPRSIQSLNRTSVHLGAGREWYLSGDGSGSGPAWRVGVDGGGRWGAAKLEVFGQRFVTDVIGAVYASVHSDLEIPCGKWILQVGLRAEWDYTWSDILPAANNSDIQSINLLGGLGVRF